VTPDDLVLGETPCETHQSVTVRSSIRIRTKRGSVIVALISVRTSLSMARMFMSASGKIFDNVRPQFSSTSFFNEQSRSVFPKDPAHFSPSIGVSSVVIVVQCHSSELCRSTFAGNHCNRSDGEILRIIEGKIHSPIWKSG
jgi:hypothetical protein